MRVITPFASHVLSAAIVALTCCAAMAEADWGRVTITPTATPIPIVEGCSDGANGAFVAWQEGSPTGVLRAKHLLSTGHIDPAWPASGAAVCDVVFARSELMGIPDRLGGVYLAWKEGNGLYVTRLDPTGAVAAGWPARGRSLGGVYADSPRPVLVEDGSHGIYLAWGGSTSTALAMHLGPANTGAGGWPNSSRAISVADLMYNTVYWPQIALAPDGGLFVAYAVSSTDETSAPSAWRLRRLTSAGITATGWPAEGLSFGSFPRTLLGSPVKSSLVALSPDGRGGVFLTIGNPIGNEGWASDIETRMYRLQGSGESALDWPASGKLVTNGPSFYVPEEFGATPDFSFRLFPGAADGALAGFPQFGTDNGSSMNFARCDPTGQFGWSANAAPVGNEVAGIGLAGDFVASFYPSTDPFYYGGVAFLRLQRVGSPPGWTDWSEYHAYDYGTWYGDIGLAATEDGNAVLVWSQVQGRVGLFAQHFNSSGAVTAVEPESRAVLALSALRFVPGVGVRAAISTPVDARFELFDLAGRRIAAQSITAGEVTLAGTAALPSGLYFGRLVAGKDAITGKGVIAR